MARTPSTPLILLAAGLAASLALWLGLTLLGGPGGDSIADMPSASDGPRGADLVRASADSGRTERDPLASSALDRPPSPSPPEPQAPAAADTTVVWGFVRERQSGAGLADCAVAVRGMPRATTDQTGRFELEIDGPGGEPARLRIVRVEHAGQGVLFYGTVRVQPGMEILVEPQVVLRGRVEDSTGRPVRTSGVSAYIPSDRLREVEWFLGSSGEASDESRFELRVRPPLPHPPAVELQVVVGATSFRATASWSALASDEGARIVVDACAFRLALTEPDGTTPVLGADVRLAAWLDGEEEPVCRAVQLLETAQPLVVTLPRAATAIEVAVGVSGFAARVERLGATPCGETWTLALERLGPEDVLAGHVRAASGRPVEEAWVTCNPATRDGEVGVAVHSGASTDAEGRFRLPFAAGQPAELRAYHRDHGLTPDLEVAGGRRDIVLRFPAVQFVTVTAHFPAGAQLAQAGHVLEWVLAREDGEVVSGSERSSPFVLEELLPGDHRLFVVAAGGALFASAAVSVFPGVDTSAELELRPALRAGGLVLHADGSPASAVQVRVATPDWPQVLVESWGTALTDGGGAFDLLVGSAVQPRLVLSRDGRELLRATVPAGSPAEIRLP